MGCGMRKEKTGEVNERVKFSSIRSKAAVKHTFITPIIHFLGVLRRLPLTSGRPTTRALNKHLTELQDELISVSFFHLFLELEEIKLPVLNKSFETKSCEMIRCQTKF